MEAITIESEKIKCPKCGNKVWAEIYEVEAETNLPTETGFHVYCSEHEEEWFNSCLISYEEGIILNLKVYDWLVKNVRKIPVNR